MKRLNHWRMFFASFIIVIGAIILLQNLIPQIAMWLGFWPIFILIPGMFFLLNYAESDRHSSRWFEYTFGLSLTFLALFLFFNQFTGWFYFDQVGFALPLTFAIPLLFASFKWRKRWLGYLTLIFALISLFWFSKNYNLLQYFYAIIIILIGIVLVLRKTKTKKK